MRLDSFFSGALCVLSGGRLPEALFMVFLLDSKSSKKCVNLVDLAKSFQTSFIHVPFLSISFQIDPNSNEYLLAKFGFDTAENEPLKVCQKLAKS